MLTAEFVYDVALQIVVDSVSLNNYEIDLLWFKKRICSNLCPLRSCLVLFLYVEDQ